MKAQNQPSILTITAACVALSLSLFTSSASAQAIGINLGSGRPDAALDPTESAGVIPQTNWNNLAGATGGPLALVDNSADATPAMITWDTQEQWSIGAIPADANGKLLNGFFAEQNAAPDSTIDITGIPYANYNLYIYVSHDRTSEDVILSEAGGAFDDFTAVFDNTDITAPVTFTQQTISATGAGNYVLFSELSAATLNISLKPVDLGPGTLDRNSISAIQIESVNSDDDDGDGLSNAWELLNSLDPDDNGLNPNNNGAVGNPDNGAAGDPDSDGSPNLREQTQRSDPRNPDTDGDTLQDGVETGDGMFVDMDNRGTDPLQRDTDGDTLEDSVEDNGGTVVDPATMTGTNPNLADTDGDTLRDDWEVQNMFDPADNGDIDPVNGAAGDPDNDNSDNAMEQARNTDPRNEDTDGDDLIDSVETDDGMYVDAANTGTDPLDADSDDDTLPDGVENNTGTFVDATMTGTNPNSLDSDADAFRDDWEIDNGRNPSDPSDSSLAESAIGLNMGAGRADASLDPAVIAGAYPQPNWNNLSATTGDSIPLVDDMGVASGASFSWQMDEEWSVAGPAVDGNGTLLTGWVSANDGGATNTLDITEIPFDTYDLLIYTNHDRNGEDALISEANGAFPTFLARESNADITAEVVLRQQVASVTDVATERGNFVVFSGLTGSNLNLMIAGDDPNAPRGPISGIQLINRGTSEFAITEIELDEGAGTATITWETVPGGFYSIDGSFDMAENKWLELEEAIEATGNTLSHTETGLDFTTTTRRFYQIRRVEAN